MANTKTAEVLTDWEKTTCSRCAGSGHYSYCEMYGTTCFKCGGKKTVLTKRGAAALAWLREQRSIVAANVTVGMIIRVDGVPGFVKGGLMTVREVLNPDINKGVTLNFDNFSWGMGLTSQVQVIPATKEERIAQVQAAIAYQNTLTKAGKPRKV